MLTDVCLNTQTVKFPNEGGVASVPVSPNEGHVAFVPVSPREGGMASHYLKLILLALWCIVL